MSSRGLSLRRITGHCTVAGDRVTAWYRLAPQGWSFRPDSVREQLIVDAADAFAQLCRRNLHLRVTTRPYPVSRWAEAQTRTRQHRSPDGRSTSSATSCTSPAGAWLTRRSTSGSTSALRGGSFTP